MAGSDRPDWDELRVESLAVDDLIDASVEVTAAPLPTTSAVGDAVELALHSGKVPGGDDEDEDLGDGKKKKKDRGALFAFGSVCYRIADDETQVLAHDLTPVAEAVSADGEHGVLVRFRTSRGEREQFVPAASWASARAASKAAEALSSAGARIEPGWHQQGSASDIVRALGHWAMGSEERPQVEYTRQAGWQNATCYANGSTVFDAKRRSWVYDGPPERNQRSGTHEQWKAGIGDLIATPVAQLALAVALAGPLVAPLRGLNTGWHIHGASSAGKSSVLELARSVWGDRGWLHPWNATQVAFEHYAVLHRDACLFLDEIKEADAARVLQTVHMLSDGKSRGRSKRDGSGLLGARTWCLTWLSTGEQSAAEIGDTEWQGGHSVRLVDVPIEAGDATLDAEHAVAITQFADDCYGCAADAWVQHLVRLRAAPGGLRRLRRLVEARHRAWRTVAADDIELGRIGHAVALISVAWDEAYRCGVLPEVCAWDGDLIPWLFGRLKADRGPARDPYLRCWHALLRNVHVHPDRYPTKERLRGVPPRECYGVIIDFASRADGMAFVPDQVGEVELHTQESMLRASGIARSSGTSVRAFVDWMLRSDLAERSPKKTRFAGRRARWITIYLDRTPPGCDA